MLTSLTPPSCGELEALSLDARCERILADAKLGRMLGEAIGSNGLEPGLITIDDLACAIIDLLPVLISKIAAPGENSMTTPVAPSPEWCRCSGGNTRSMLSWVGSAWATWRSPWPWSRDRIDEPQPASQGPAGRAAALRRCL